MIAEIPILNVGAAPSAELCRRDIARMREMVEAALGPSSHPLLPLARRLLDPLSRRWLHRQADPFLEEIRTVAALLGASGAWFLNACYEWACSTSVGADPGGDGARMIRVLDWGLAGLGRHVVIARCETAEGPYYSATWPGYAGVLTAMAPGRFSGAINQAPRVPRFGVRPLDRMLARLAMLSASDTVLASHLLRRVFERARDFTAALAMLADSKVRLAMPAIFALAGAAPEEGCIVEAIGSERRVHRLGGAGAIGAANQWLSPDLAGEARNDAAERGAPIGAEENNRMRRTLVCALNRGPFAGTADLPDPVLNKHTVTVASANARQGTMLVEALDPPAPGALPRVVARREIRD